MGRLVLPARAQHKQTDQTTTLCVQEVEIYLERWEVLGALVDVSRARYSHKHTGPSYKPYCMPSLTVALLLLDWLHDGVYAGRCCCVFMFVLRARINTPHHHQPAPT